MTPLFLNGLLSNGTLVLIALALVIASYLYWLNRNEKKNDTAAALCKRYAVLHRETLLTLPDEELVQAVIANILNRQDRRHPDPGAQLPFLSRGRAAVYTVWVMCHELETQDLEALLSSPSGALAAEAAAGLELLGATRSAQTLYEALPTGEGGEPPAWEALTAAFRETVSAEQPLALCIAYIRNHPDEFTDE